MYSSSSYRYNFFIFLLFYYIVLNSNVTHGIPIISSRLHSSVSSEQRNVSGIESLQETTVPVEIHGTTSYKSSCASRSVSRINFIHGGTDMNNQEKIRKIRETIGKSIKLLFGTSLALGISYIIYDNRDILFDGEKFQGILLEKINSVKDLGIIGLIYYSIGLGIWEMFGLTTIPMETVAGMTFNFHHAILANIIGKLFGTQLFRGIQSSTSYFYPNFDQKLKQSFFLSSLQQNERRFAGLCSWKILSR